jgi:hypothetical protein
MPDRLTRVSFDTILALQFAPTGPQTLVSSVEPSGGVQSVSERWIVIQREQKCKAIQVCAETMPTFLKNFRGT